MQKNAIQTAPRRARRLSRQSRLTLSMVAPEIWRGRKHFRFILLSKYVKQIKSSITDTARNIQKYSWHYESHDSLSHQHRMFLISLPFIPTPAPNIKAGHEAIVSRVNRAQGSLLVERRIFSLRCEFIVSHISYVYSLWAQRCQIKLVCTIINRINRIKRITDKQ